LSSFTTHPIPHSYLHYTYFIRALVFYHPTKKYLYERIYENSIQQREITCQIALLPNEEMLLHLKAIKSKNSSDLACPGVEHALVSTTTWHNTTHN
jgi:hypothetical protein